MTPNPVLPGTNPQLIPPPAAAQPVQMQPQADGVPQPSPTPVPPTAADFSARRGAWANFLSLLQTNPEIGQALLNFSAGALKPRGIGQTGGSVIANALAGTANMMQQQGQQKQVFALQKQRAADEAAYQKVMGAAATTEAATGQSNAITNKQRADTEKAQQAATAAAEQQRIKLLSTSTASDVNLNSAKAAYYKAQAAAAGLNSGDASSRRLWADQMADAAVATGAFTGKTAKAQAFIWATNTLLGAKGSNPQEFLNTMAQNALKAQEALNNGALTPQQMQDTINSVLQTYQSMQKQGFFNTTMFQPQSAPAAPTGAGASATAASAAFAKDPRTAKYAAGGYKLGPIDPKNGLYTIIGPDGTPVSNGVGLYSPQ